MSRRRITVLVGLAVAVLVFAGAIVTAAAESSQATTTSTATTTNPTVTATVTVSTAGSATDPVVYPADGGDYTSMRPTGLGLPQIGESGTVGAGSLTDSLNAYVSSGEYENDLSAVAGAATAYLNQRLTEATEPEHRVCAVTYRRAHLRHVSGIYYRRIKRCVREYTAPRLTGKPAIVLDIDETSLSNLDGLKATDYTVAGLVPAAAGNLPAIAPTLALYKDAVAHHVAVFFITGRASDLEAATVKNLTSAGFDEGYAALDMKPSADTTEMFKSSTRAAIEKSGYDIIVNLGDQESDLDGGYADRAFKLPDPFYFISD
jgi:predicted secreted acid phosphatase